MSSTSSVNDILGVLERVPFVGGLKRDVNALRKIVYLRRVPRIVAIGPRGVGKTRALNLLLGRPALPANTPLSHGAWISVDAAGAKVDWLELDPLLPDIAASFRRALDERAVDAVLFLADPQHVEDGLGEALEGLASALATLEKHEQPSLFAVLSRADQVPLSGPEGTALDEGQRMTIELLRQRLARQLAEVPALKIIEDHVVALSSECGPDRPKSPEGTNKARAESGLREEPPFGARQLSELVVGAMPDEAMIEAARAFFLAREARERVAQRVVQASGTLAVTVAITPVPLSDMAVIAPLQAMMVTAVAYISGRPWDVRTAGEWIAGLGMVGGAGMGLRWTAQQLVKLVPGAGSVVSASIAGAGTTALGKSAMAYFLGVPGSPPVLPGG